MREGPGSPRCGDWWPRRSWRSRRTSARWEWCLHWPRCCHGPSSPCSPLTGCSRSRQYGRRVEPTKPAPTDERVAGPWPLVDGADNVDDRIVPTRPSSLSRIFAWLAAAGFILVAAFQLALVLGAPWGEYTQGGGTSGALAPSGRIVAAVSGLVSTVMAGAILARTGTGPLRRLPRGVVTVLAWVTTVLAVITVVLNIITRSSAERGVFAPVSMVLVVLVIIVMVTTRHRGS